jgi:ANTAR domain
MSAPRRRAPAAGVSAVPAVAAGMTAEHASARSAAAGDALVQRTSQGWRVAGTDLSDLTSAMVLADLLAAELTGESPAVRRRPPAAAGAGRVTAAADVAPGTDGPGKDLPAADAGRLRATIRQLEHALMARVRVEQAIGVLAERHRIQPRQAFDQLRHAARARGRRVIDIAADVVASATNPLLQLPDELTTPRSGRRRSAARGLLGTETAAPGGSA